MSSEIMLLSTVGKKNLDEQDLNVLVQFILNNFNMVFVIVSIVLISAVVLNYLVFYIKIKEKQFQRNQSEELTNKYIKNIDDYMANNKCSNKHKERLNFYKEDIFVKNLEFQKECTDYFQKMKIVSISPMKMFEYLSKIFKVFSKSTPVKKTKFIFSDEGKKAFNEFDKINIG